jgi:hypothetical protein
VPALLCAIAIWLCSFCIALRDISVDGATAPRNPLTVGHCGNPGGLRHRLNLSSRGPRNDDRSRERSIKSTLRETEIFRPSKAGAIVGSVHRGPCADKQRVKGANRTARPDHERGSSDPMCRPPLYAGDRVTLCRNWQSVRSQPLPQIRHQMMDHLVLIHFHPVHQSLNQDDDPNEVRVTAPNEVRSSRKSYFSIHQHRQDG